MISDACDDWFVLFVIYCAFMFRKMAVQSSLHNRPTDSSECLKLESISSSKACRETSRRCKLYRAWAVMLVPFGFINGGVLAAYGTYCCGFPSPRVRLW